jgi:glucokinase
MSAVRTRHSPKVTFVGVDVGATKTAVAIGDATGRLRRRRRTPTVLRDPGALADLVSATILDLHREVGSDVTSPVGIGICGGVDRMGLVRGPIALGWVGRVDFAALVADRVGAPVTIDNDVTAGAAGEREWGAGRGIDDFIYLALGTGIGAGLVLAGAVYRGAHGLAGEIGHFSVDVAGVRCRCGNRGCIEASCGGKAIGELVTARLSREPALETSLRQVLIDGAEVTARDLFAHAASGDAFADAEVERVAAHLAAAIVNVVNLLDLTRVVVGGGLVQNDVLLPAIRRALQTTRPSLGRDPDLVVPAGLGEHAGVTGALALAIDAFATDRPAEPEAVEGGHAM